MIAAFCFDRLSAVRIFIDFNLTRLTTALFGGSRRNATIRLEIKNIDDILKAEVILGQQITNLCFELNFFL